MKKLTEENKVNILETLLIVITQDHPEFEEENTTGWDVIDNAKIWLEELRLNLLYCNHCGKPKDKDLDYCKCYNGDAWINIVPMGDSYYNDVFGVYEKEKDGVILASFNTKEEAEEAGIKFGYVGDNYYIDKIKKP